MSKDKILLAERELILLRVIERLNEMNFPETEIEHFKNSESLDKRISEEGLEGVKVIVMDSYSFNPIVKKWGEEFDSRNLPYILLDSNNDPGRQIENTNAFGYLRKPFSQEAYVSMINRVLGESSQ